MRRKRKERRIKDLKGFKGFNDSIRGGLKAKRKFVGGFRSYIN